MNGGTTFTFVTGGIESALEQARAAAGDKDVLVAGGAEAAQQYLAAGLLDELQIHVVPLLLGDGVRLFANLGSAPAGARADARGRLADGDASALPRREVAAASGVSGRSPRTRGRPNRPRASRPRAHRPR